MALFNNAESDGKDGTEALATQPKGSLARMGSQMTVGSLEKSLLREFPAKDALEWDRTGLTVGEPAMGIVRVAVALDPTVSAIKSAAARAANVLVTHHPPYLEVPQTFGPGRSPVEHEGAVVWAAIQHGVSLMNFHTALDVSPRAARVLPGMLGLSYRNQVLEPIGTSRSKGFGQICSVRPEDDPLSLGQLAARCTSVFGRQPRVWGDFDYRLSRIATCTGSAGGLDRLCLAAGIDCLVCGEIRYHTALDLSQAGVGIIEIGHDLSELPLVAILLQAVLRAGVPEDNVFPIDQASNWRLPETTRI